MKNSDETPFLELRGLEKSFGSTRVIERLQLDLGEGEILALVGPSGSGKTTILRLLAGFERPDRGAIVIAGEDVTTQAPARRGFGMVFQHYALFPHMTVHGNIAFGLEARGWERARIDERVEAVLRSVDLAGFGERRVSEISGGQQQRIALARALAPEPRVLLLDEPLSNLDPSLRERTRQELRAMVREIGITTVLVTHEQDEAFHLGDRVALLHGGRLEQVGTPSELYEAPATKFVATFVGRASILRGEVVDVDGVEVRLRLGGTPGVEWPALAVGSLAVGQSVDLVVRPEGLALIDEAPHGLAGKVVERRYTGPVTYATVRLQNGERLEVAGETRVGDRVSVAPRARALAPPAFAALPGGAAE